MTKKYSGKQVIKAGEQLLDSSLINRPKDFEHVMNVLSYWRFSHEIPLEKSLKILQETTLKIDKSAIFAKRLKRYPSIVTKLTRFKDMKLKNMQDIGGSRAIVSNLKKLEKVVRELKTKPEFKDNNNIKYKDYIKTPKEDGYRGYHLIGRFKDENGDSKNIEIQLRTNLQHDWATALEIVDLFTGQALKSNQGSKDWSDFFSNVSEQFAIMETIHLFDIIDNNEKNKKFLEKMKNNEKFLSSCEIVQNISGKLDVPKRFDAFSNSLKIIDSQIKESSVNGYVLVEVDTKICTVKSTLFNHENNKEAEEQYINAEKSAAGKSDIVVALVSAKAVGGIKEAYPNYFANSTEFLNNLSFIINANLNKKTTLFNWLKNSLSKSGL